jgi:glycerophosphoryl diester phosphodiesterase
MRAPDWLTARPIAHRGLHGDGLIENTLGAAAAAVAANYAIEVDLQLSADDEVIVFHDATLDRLTEAQGPIAARTAAELKDVTLKHSKDHIPTLSDLLALVAGRTPLVLELKSEWDGDDRLVRRTAETLAGYAGPAAVMSFDPALVTALRRLAPHLVRGIVAEQWYRHDDGTGFPRPRQFALGNLLHLPRTRPHFVAYAVYDLPATAPRAARRLFGMPLLTWTVRTEADRARASRCADQMIFEGFRP